MYVWGFKNERKKYYSNITLRKKIFQFKNVILILQMKSIKNMQIE